MIIIASNPFPTGFLSLSLQDNRDRQIEVFHMAKVLKQRIFTSYLSDFISHYILLRNV